MVNGRKGQNDRIATIDTLQWLLCWVKDSAMLCNCILYFLLFNVCYVLVYLFEVNLFKLKNRRGIFSGRFFYLR